MSLARRVLAVDDEPSTLRLLEYILAKAGYEVHLAADGEEGLAAVSRVLPHLIVCDVLMPHVDGLEMCRRVRELPGFEMLPFVFLSARSQIAERIEGLETGADDYIAKPFDREEFLARIEAVLRRAEGYQKIARKDSLTDLGDREFFHERLAEELYREQRYGVSSTLALVAIDLDDLAEIQEQHGSAGCDLLLRHVGRFLRDNVRSLDVPTRYSLGGFVILMPHTSRDRALIAIERLSREINESELELNGEPVPVAASFGVAVVEGELGDLTEMLNRAHEAVILARRNEATKVHVWSPDDVTRTG